MIHLIIKCNETSATASTPRRHTHTHSLCIVKKNNAFLLLNLNTCKCSIWNLINRLCKCSQSLSHKIHFNKYYKHGFYFHHHQFSSCISLSLSYTHFNNSLSCVSVSQTFFLWIEIISHTIYYSYGLLVYINIAILIIRHFS